MLSNQGRPGPNLTVLIMGQVRTATNAARAEGPAPRSAHPREQRWIYLLALVLALAPFVVSAATLVRRSPETLIGDRAREELRVRDVGVHPVNVGLYSRDGWSHPGPLLFETLALPYRLLGSDSTALLLGALTINAVAIWAMAAIARRVGGIPVALLVLLASACVIRASGSEFLRDPWVLPITVLPFGLFCVLSWAITDGRIWALPVTAGVLSFLIQTHVGYLAIAAPVFVLAAIALVVLVRREEPRRTRELRNGALLTVAVVLVVWAPPIWDELFGYSNLSIIVDWFRSAPGASHTLAEGLRIVLAQLAIPPDWITGATHVGLVSGESTLGSSAPLPWLLVPFVAALWIAWRRRDLAATRLLVVLGATLATGVLAVSRTIGFMYAYRFGWTLMLGALAAAAAAWVAWQLVAERFARAAMLLGPVLVVVLAGVAIATSVDVVDHHVRFDATSAETGTVTKLVAPQVRRDGGQIVLRAGGVAGGWSREGLLLALERQGFDVRVPIDSGHAFGAHRARDDGPVQATLLVLAGDELVGRVDRPGWRLVAYAGNRPLTQELRYIARTNRRLQALTRALSRGDISRDVFARRLQALDHRSSGAVAVMERTA